MLESIKKGLQATVGAAVLTRRRIRENLDKLVKEGKLSGEEADRLADEMVEEGRRELTSIQEKIASSWHKSLKGLDIVTRKEFEDLTKRVEALEKSRPSSTARSRSPKPV
jgi:polyhydroxyalkanoate synthesis regulator phasin